MTEEGRNRLFPPISCRHSRLLVLAMKDARRMKDSVCMSYTFRSVTLSCVKWMPAAAILSKIAIYGKIQVNRQAIQTLVLSLEKYRFRTRRNAQGSTEYEVVDLQNDEVNKGFGK